ncbi:MAG: HNH endonuclease [Thermoflexaceae bacterium]|nr:HNH endonuclease [Thermoflexaceae bacterium]
MTAVRSACQILERDGHQCVACGAGGVRFEVDHIVPLAAGGSNELANLRTLCVPCHRRRAARPAERP